MAVPAAYTFVANGLVKFFTEEVHKLPDWEEGFIPMDKIPTAAGATAKVAVDLYEQFLAQKNKENG